MNKSTRIPPLNSLRFIPANKVIAQPYNTWPFDQGFFYQQLKAYFQFGSDYVQKIAGDDVVTVYCDSLAEHIDIKIVDEKGAAVTTVVANMLFVADPAGNIDSKFGDQLYTFIKTFKPSDLGLADGYYHCVIQAIYTADDDPDTNTIFVSECFQVRNAGWKNTMLFEYTNDINDFDILFEAFDGWIHAGVIPGMNIGFRCESFIDTDPASHDSVFEDMECQVTSTQSVPYRVGLLTIGGFGGVPTYVLDKVNRILSCDSFFIDTVQWKKEDGSKWSIQKVDNYTMKSASITLRDNPENSEWEFNNSDDPGTFRIFDDVFDEVFD